MEAQSISIVDEFFVPNGYLIFKVAESKLGKMHILPRILIYESDAMKVQDLVEIFLGEYNIRPKQFGQDKIICFALDGVGALDLKKTIFEVKDQLHNQATKTIEFKPYLTGIDRYNYQCSGLTPLDFSKNEQFRSLNSPQNQVQFCIQFPQFHEVCYSNFNASSKIGDEINKFLKMKNEQFNKDLSLLEYTITCKGCEQQVKPTTFIYELAHFSVELKFPKLAKIPQKSYLENIQIRVIEGIDNEIKIIPYADIMKKKIKTILEQCKIMTLNMIDTYGLKILNTILKPIDFISKVESQLCVLNQATIDAHIIEESEIFYSIQPLFKINSFQLSEIKATLKSEETIRSKERLLSEIYQRRMIRINESPISIHKQSSFIDPILGYTSELYYRELNLHLRLTNFGKVPESDYFNYEYKFSFALIRSLLKLPNYGGMAYRGVDYKDNKSKKGNIISFNSFTSTSSNYQKALLFGRRTIYKIHSLTGKNITDFSYFKTEGEVLFMPYTYFEVMDVSVKTQIGQREQIIIELREIPIPRRQNNNLLFWIDDDPMQASLIYKSLFTQFPNIQTEIIQLVSNDHLKIWNRKFGAYFKKKNKISLITDMKRGQLMEEGIQTIRLMRKYVKNLDIFIYVHNLQKTIELLESKGEKLSPSLGIGKSKKEVATFIQQKVVDKSQLDEKSCQLI